MNAVTAIDEPAMKYGLLLEAAQAQQELIESGVRELREHTRGLDAVVREQIRRTLIEELGAVVEESNRAVDALRLLERGAKVRLVVSSLLATLLSGAAAAAAAWWLLPSPDQVRSLQAQRDRLAAEIELLDRQAGLIDLRRCGTERRWCVRIDRQAPVYGEQSDYLVVRGY
jgi:hypothetical protein